MEWETPQFERSQINKAAALLVRTPYGTKPDQINQAYDLVSNWRSSHSFPLNTFQIGLRGRAEQAASKYVVAQRLKRFSSIFWKLMRFPEMKLSQMQDIAGCRAIVASVSEVDALVKLYKSSRIKHRLVHEDDYIRNPKESGYRSVHVIYRYYSDKKSKSYNGLKVEVQLRSELQHTWATAVETVGTFMQQALKSSLGEEDWLRFFTLMGSAFAMRERTTLVPNTPATKRELKHELREYERRLDIINHLRIYGAALQNPILTDTKDAHFFLLELDSIAKQITVTGYKPDELEKASQDYLFAERQIAPGQGRDAVLVSVDSVSALKKAYPNYFLDMHKFIQATQQALA